MKVRHIFLKIAVIVLILHLAAGGLIGSQIQDSVINMDLDQVISAMETNDGLNVDDQFIRNNSIFSSATLISLLVAVMGVVAFRRNNES